MTIIFEENICVGINVCPRLFKVIYVYVCMYETYACPCKNTYNNQQLIMLLPRWHNWLYNSTNLKVSYATQIGHNNQSKPIYFEHIEHARLVSHVKFCFIIRVMHAKTMTSSLKQTYLFQMQSLLVIHPKPLEWISCTMYKHMLHFLSGNVSRGWELASKGAGGGSFQSFMNLRHFTSSLGTDMEDNDKNHKMYISNAQNKEGKHK